MSDGRLSVFKTYKLYVGGKFPRSESGRVYEVTDPKGKWLANVPQSSRKDARDAVVAARKAFGGWSGATAYNRGQILYRIAEMLEGRREQFVREVADAEGLSKSKAAAVVDAAIDRWVWYAGWTDKIGQVVGGANPVAGPFFNLSTPEPTGVVAVLAPQESSLLGLVSVLAPVIATGNTAVVVASADAPLPALSLGEVLATSDLPGGVVNILSGRTAELAAPLASHQDVNGIDLTGAAGDAELAKELEAAAAENLKRVLRPSVSRHRPEKEAKGAARPQAVEDGADWSADPGTHRLTAFLETKTVWHPTGALGASGSSY
ncbi:MULTISPECIES: aldehyde dehydrogenase family protein [unclassified Streptomyces]|uniref:aldehyde dehydrogenase family protein n=1 Tax=unclassified Streptomyces TaxID=2593676 RepID=UPI00081BAA5C|nr:MULTISPECIES: aldehyde dehydrogenase family protein [unclassified Streptomyces]MYQ52000.1 aldehyde dehydrogenase family protein [Streptomyces sp. SID4941]SCD72943.1 Aldehyde dehydrogenase family protein [Streptomyces sp. PalvLS-984]SDD99396.1 NAD-dependent aldehyde dehydrogenases [Streptomyces sp. AmelKG-A3]